MKRVALHKMESIDDTTSRMKVPGGWLYMTWVEDRDAYGGLGGVIAFAQTFVPDPQKEV